MTFLVQCGINQHSYIFQRLTKSHKPKGKSNLLLNYPKCTRNHVTAFTNCTPISSVTIIYKFPKSKTLAAYASTFEIENPCRLSTQMLAVVLVESSPLWRNEITATFPFFFLIKNNVSCRISYFSFSGNPQIGEREAKSFLRRTNVVV